MPVTPAFSMSLALAAADAVLQQSATFAARVEAADPGASLDSHIYYDQMAANSGIASLRPYALLKVGSRGTNVLGEGVAVDLVVGGGIILLLEFNADQTITTHKENYLDALNFFGGVIDEIEALSGVNDNLAFRSDVVFPPLRTRRAERDPTNLDYWSMVAFLDYGAKL